MEVYPLKFTPIYKDKIWGGRNLERLFARPLPPGVPVGESWEIADLAEGESRLANGPLAGASINEITRRLGGGLLGRASALPDGRFPLLLKLLDANDTLSLQVHPDEQAVKEIGPAAALKTECWYIVESRGGYIYKGVKSGVTPEQFRAAIERDKVADLVRRIDVKAGDFHYLPAGTVHALGAGVIIAEVQTPSDTTYRVTDWGRGREIHVELSMRCIRFGLTGDNPPGLGGERLLETDYFSVYYRSLPAERSKEMPPGRCVAIMVMSGCGEVRHGGDTEPAVDFRAGDTLLLPASLRSATLAASESCTWLEIHLPESR